MQTSIIQIGNSKGLILPADFLKSLNLGLKSLVSITTDNGAIVIKPATRSGWLLQLLHVMKPVKII